MNTRDQNAGKLIFRKEPEASIIQEVLEGYASGRFQTQAEIQHYLDTIPEYPKGPSGKTYCQHPYDLLTCIHYAGYYDYPSWGVGLTKAWHEPLISYETYLKIQELLKGQR